ncbi:DUF4828 domain-containing protein [Levilactobacillus bambusae]|uniref:DUF4828 domain-containing protein n=1 Tax=Levilactobacillus bambusae TaxID=2024736 RepID=A0A2V1MYP2_9LACO|nr:DUF4828 domain-containing protein [Levilactobacillus bambusae]PWF99931.1 DUF4828 domain-containing protein [Levilactobacillus bambusae]
MKARRLALFGVSLFAGLTSGRQLKRTKEQPDQSPLFFSGTWVFEDPRTLHRHVLVVSPNLDLALDDQPVRASVKEVTANQLVYTDQYGYELKIQADDQQPRSFFDEADDQTYYFLTSIN